MPTIYTQTLFLALCLGGPALGASQSSAFAWARPLDEGDAPMGAPLAIRATLSVR